MWAVHRGRWWFALIALILAGIPFGLLQKIVADYQPSQDGDVMVDQSTGRTALIFYGCAAGTAGVALLVALVQYRDRKRKQTQHNTGSGGERQWVLPDQPHPAPPLLNTLVRLVEMPQMKAESPLDPNTVTDREAFLRFVRALMEDRQASVAAEKIVPSSPYAPAVGGWENVTIEAFLEAALAWAEATEMGENQGLPAGPSWRAFAAFLYCGKVYE
ncbi:MAG: DUF7660 family protein [Gemmataceae bacterium]